MLADTGIRKLREKPVFMTPNVFPPDGFEQDDSGDAEFREVVEPQHCYVCKQHYVDRPPLLRSALPGLRRLQLPQAHGDRRPTGPRGAAHGRARQDRLPGGDQAAARRRAADRHDPLSARRRGALRGRSPTSRSGATGSRSSASICATRRASRRSASTSARPRPARLHRQQRVPDRAPPVRVLPAHDRARDRLAAS